MLRCDSYWRLSSALTRRVLCEQMHIQVRAGANVAVTGDTRVAHSLVVPLATSGADLGRNFGSRMRDTAFSCLSKEVFTAVVCKLHLVCSLMRTFARPSSRYKECQKSTEK